MKAVVERRQAEARFADVTETTGTPVSPEGASMMYTRYWVAAQLASGKRVLELGCGSGQGLGLVGKRASWLVAGDVSSSLLWCARSHYGSRVPLVQFSAEALPFASGVFDVVLLFEASYYIPRMADALREIVRVLAPAGTALLVNANPERPDFIRSPYSVHYYTADELRTALEPLGFVVTVEGAFPIGSAEGGRSHVSLRLVSLTRRVLESLRLVPRTLRGRARLKRLLYGKLDELPGELPEEFAPVAPRMPLGRGPVPNVKVIYVTARKRS